MVAERDPEAIEYMLQAFGEMLTAARRYWRYGKRMELKILYRNGR